MNLQTSLFEENSNLLPFNGEVYYYPNYFPAAAADDFFIYLQQNILWKQEPIKMFGKVVMQPRLTALYGDVDKPYAYSGILMKPQPWNEGLLQIKKQVEATAGINFSTVLLNFYRNGADSMGWHRDNEKELGTNPVIGSVSFGAGRTFQLRNYQNKKLKKSLELTHGSFLLMRGSTQHHWEHQLPKSTLNIGPRINLTFRYIPR